MHGSGCPRVMERINAKCLPDASNCQIAPRGRRCCGARATCDAERISHIQRKVLVQHLAQRSAGAAAGGITQVRSAQSLQHITEPTIQGPERDTYMAPGNRKPCCILGFQSDALRGPHTPAMLPRVERSSAWCSWAALIHADLLPRHRTREEAGRHVRPAELHVHSIRL